jgi:hypothetical protein
MFDVTRVCTIATTMYVHSTICTIDSTARHADYVGVLLRSMQRDPWVRGSNTVFAVTSSHVNVALVSQSQRSRVPPTATCPLRTWEALYPACTSRMPVSGGGGPLRDSGPTSPRSSCTDDATRRHADGKPRHTATAEATQ